MSKLFRTKNIKTQNSNVPYLHQVQAMQFAMKGWNNHKKHIILNHKMGLGKTATSVLIYILRSLVHGKCKPLVIVCPKACIGQWKDTILNFTHIPESQILLPGQKKPKETPLVTIQTYTKICKEFTRTHQFYPDLHEMTNKVGRVYYKGGWDIRGKKKIEPGYYQDPAPEDMPMLTEMFTDDTKMVIIDEVHEARNKVTATCNALGELTKRAEYVIGCTGTLVVNGLDDLAGETRAMSLAFDGQHAFSKDATLTEKVKAVDKLDAWIHRVDKAVENLPPVDRKAVTYDLNIPNTYYQKYDGNMREMKQLYSKIEEEKHEKDDFVRFLQLFKELQLLAFHPALFKYRGELFEKPELLEAATEPEQYTGAIYAILETLKNLQASGHKRIIVTSMLLKPMYLVMAILTKQRKSGQHDYGKLYEYSGKMTLAQRDAAKESFLECSKSILFLNAKAGGLGLDGLQRGVEAMVFMGFHPWNAATTSQVEARIIRTGQEAPITGRVSIIHVACQGGPDYAVGGVYKDKVRIAKCVDNTLGRTMTTNDLLRTLRVMDRLEEPHKHPDGFLKFQPADVQKKPIVFDKEFIPTVFYQ